MVIGGIAAGIVMNIVSAVASNTLMSADQVDLARRLGMDPSMMDSGSALVPWILVDLLVGILIVFTYAAIRPRFGAGPKTALIAAGILFIGSSLIVYGFSSMGLMGHGAFVRGGITWVIGYGLAGLVGGFLYKEA